MPLNRNVWTPPYCRVSFPHHFTNLRIHLTRQITMNDSKQLSVLIGDIYDAALDPSQRTDVLDKIASFTGGHSGGLLSKHALSTSENLYCYIGTDPESLQAYSESYPKLDSTADPMSIGVGQVVSTADLVQGVSAGMILLDANGRFVHANAAGNAILEAEDFRRAGGGRLVASDVPINAALRDILIAADAGAAALGIKGVALPLTARDGERYVAHVLPLTSGARRRMGAAYNAAAALFIRKTTLEAFSPPEVIGRMYKLTPSELRVLLAIVDIGGVSEGGAGLGAGVTTLQNPLRPFF